MVMIKASTPRDNNTHSFGALDDLKPTNQLSANRNRLSSARYDKKLGKLSVFKVKS